MDPLSPSRQTAPWSASSQPYDDAPRESSPLPSSSNISPYKDPKVFGAPPPGLVSPPSDAVDYGEDGQAGEGSKEKLGPFLRVRVGGLERNRKDLLIRFDASTNLPNFRSTLYRNMQRSYVEFQRFVDQAQASSPHTIIPALPLPSTSAMTDAEDDRLVRIAIQRWFTRVCEDPALQQDDELRAFIESEFSYNPVPHPSLRRPASASSSATNVFTAALSKVVRRGPFDEDEELASARGALEKLEGNWGKAAASVNALGKARRAHALTETEVGARLVGLSTVESDMQLAAAVRKMGRGYEQLANLAGSQAVSENVSLSDSLGYQALNARAAKDVLLQRVQTLEDSQFATKTAINKRRQVERLRGSSSISPVKVDEAIHEMDQANALEHQLSARLNAISRHLHVALRNHSRNTHEDVALALLENARLTVGFHKHSLRELEALRPDIARIGTTGYNVPRPSIPTSTQPQLPAAPSVPSVMGRGVSQDQMPPSQRAYDGTQSMIQPGPPQRPSSAGGPPTGPIDPLGGMGMAQSVVLPGQRAQTLGRAGSRRLDERQAAKLLAGGF